MGESDRAAEARALQALLDPLSLAVRDIPVRGLPRPAQQARPVRSRPTSRRAVRRTATVCTVRWRTSCGSAGRTTRPRAATRSCARASPPTCVRTLPSMRLSSCRCATPAGRGYRRRAAPCAERPDGRRSRQETDDGEEAASADEVFEEYCRTVEETAAWGGQVELGALAKLLDRSITVYSVGMPAVRMGPDEPGAAPAVWLGESCACCARPHQAPCARQAQAIRACCVCATYAMRLDWASTTTVLSPRAIPSARHAAADVTACCLLPVLALPAGQWTFVRLYAGQLHLNRPSSGPHEPR